MSELDKSTPPQPEEKPPAYVPPPTKEKRQRSVVHYIAILFAAAFVLMLITYVMDMRQNEEVVESLNQSVSGLRESISSMQSAQDVYEDNMALLEQVSKMEAELKALEKEAAAAKTANEQQEKSIQAMDWFWQINEAYVKGQYTKAKELIAQMEEAGLNNSLPRESVTDNGRFSPADRYQEIYDALFA